MPPVEPVASAGQPMGVAGPIVSIDLSIPPYCFPPATAVDVGDWVVVGEVAAGFVGAEVVVTGAVVGAVVIAGPVVVGG